MDFRMTDSENIMRKVAKDFAESEIEPKVEIMEQTGEFPVELLKTMARIGITGIITPEREMSATDARKT